LETIADRLKAIRSERGETQPIFAKFLEITPRTYIRYESAESTLDADSLLRIHNKLSIDINWLLSGVGEKYPVNLFQDQTNILKILCKTENEFDSEMNNFIEASKEAIDKIISQKIVDNLLKIKEETPFLRRLRGLVWFDDVGATVALYTIFTGVPKKNDGRMAKEKFLDYCNDGYFTVAQLKESRSIFRYLINTWDDEICEYILQNQESFTNALRTLKPAADSAISSNQKYEDAKKSAINLAKGVYSWLTK